MKAGKPEVDVDELYRTFAPMVFRRCFFLLRNEESAHDVMQEVFVQVLRFQDRLHWQGPSSLLYTIATRLSLNTLRRKRWDALPEDISVSDRHEDQTLARLFLDRIFREEAPDTRVMAVYRWVDGMTLEETASMTGLSDSGVRKRLKKLQTTAQNQGVAASKDSI